ncbi:hypothetical protein D0T53_13195 [Dysgonomonas sp. 216]|uniref:DUF6242 domain-containing protein n=1 Tax=Dysgonomonas sp. 216 TaxID=2302934 RepID=UPI0013D542E6|nr:DUF6242 domain-containing protein [Dysgonomonas sp. 216]NDW19856.1 hypothetical protein [Dysgonomonas sp. 216]
MKLRYIVFLFVGLFFAFSCGDDNSSYTYSTISKDAQIYSFKLAATHLKEGDSLSRAQDSIRFIKFNKTKFAIDQVKERIYNPDSLPYGMKLDKAYMTLTYGTYGASKITLDYPNDTTYDWTYTDSIKISKNFKIIVTAADGSSTKEYDVDIRIHKIDPDTIIWSQAGIMPNVISPADRKVILVNEDTFYAYAAVSGRGLVLHTAHRTLPLTWEEKSVSGLPLSGISTEGITFMDGRFFLVTDSGDSYYSEDGQYWMQKNNGRNIYSILGILPDISGAQVKNLLLVTYTDNGKLFFGTSEDLSSIEKVRRIQGTGVSDDASIKAGFPVKNMTGLTNVGDNQWSNILMLVGGTDINGDELNSSWLFEKTSNGFGVSESSPIAGFGGKGLSTFFYDDFIYTFSGDSLYSTPSWGVNWKKVSSKQQLNPDMEIRKNQSVIADNENYIWIFGGVSEGNIPLYDIWRGRLNRLAGK